MNDIQKLVESGMKLIEELNEARLTHVTNVLALIGTERGLALAGAHAENRAVAAAGDEKALGPNAEARKRAWTIALGRDGIYQEALGLYMQALSDARLAQARVDALENALGLLKAALYANASRE